MNNGHLIITLDGPAGAGKSTVSKELARLLNISYLDTGAMYRAVTLKALREGINLEDEEAFANLVKRSKIDFADDGKGGLNIILDGQDVSQEIRSLEVTNNTFYAARAPKVREILVEWQQVFGAKHSLVGEGRDLGTVVFPKANYKIYLDADVNERCDRRIRELKEQGKVFDEAKLREDLIERDRKDFTRAAGPLKKSDDMLVVDCSGLSVLATAQKILKTIGK